MTLFSAACRQSGDNSMTNAWKKASAFAAVVQRIFLEGLSQRIARGGAHPDHAEVRSKSLGVTRKALPPLRRSIAVLVDPSGDSHAGNGIGTECIEKVIVQLRFLRGTRIGQVQLRWGCGWGDVGGVFRLCWRLRMGQPWQSHCKQDHWK